MFNILNVDLCELCDYCFMNHDKSICVSANLNVLDRVNGEYSSFVS